MRNEKTTVGELAATSPAAIVVYKQLGIDFCCGGNRPLQQALEEKRVTTEQFDTLLREVQAERGAHGQADFRDMSAKDLSSYIEDTHHTYLRRALPETAEYLGATLKAHGRNHRELFEVYRLFGQLKTDLEQHLVKEENLLFPSVAERDVTEDTRSLAQEIIREHEAAGEILASLHKVTNDFAVPEDACPTYARAYELLHELEDDLHQHIHLENNILLKDYDVR